MFKNIVTDSNAALQAIIAFTVTFSVFFLIMLRAWFVRKSDDDRVANLPLEDDSATSKRS